MGVGYDSSFRIGPVGLGARAYVGIPPSGSTGQTAPTTLLLVPANSGFPGQQPPPVFYPPASYQAPPPQRVIVVRKDSSDQRPIIDLEGMLNFAAKALEIVLLSLAAWIGVRVVANKHLCKSTNPIETVKNNEGGMETIEKLNGNGLAEKKLTTKNLGGVSDDDEISPSRESNYQVALSTSKKKERKRRRDNNRR